MSNNLKHKYYECPYNLTQHTYWGIKDTNCPWCLQAWVVGCEWEYRGDADDEWYATLHLTIALK